jgi:hypothetical protein
MQFVKVWMMSSSYIECKGCGNDFIPKYNGTSDELKFCYTCLKIKTTKIETPNMDLQRKPHYKKAKKSMSKIAKCVANARALSMSYGQYMAYVDAVRRGDRI